jgi:hypothetical protein
MYEDDMTFPRVISDEARIGYATVSVVFISNCIVRSVHFLFISTLIQERQGYLSGAVANVYLTNKFGFGKVIHPHSYRINPSCETRFSSPVLSARLWPFRCKHQQDLSHYLFSVTS